VKQEKLKLDFVSWHYYNCTLDPRVYAEQIASVRNTLNKLGFPPTVRTVYSEWNINGNVVPANDSFYAGANAAATLAVLHRTNTGSFFFMPKDPRGPREFHGWFGAITFSNQPKPVYNFFDAYSRLRGREVRVTTKDETVGAFAAEDRTGGKKTLRVLVWNFDGNSPFGARRKIILTLPLKNGTYKKAVYVIDRQHSNPAANPGRPGLEQIEAGEQAVTGPVTWPFELENGGVWFMELGSGK
jgi:beta-xylosidase